VVLVAQFNILLIICPTLSDGDELVFCAVLLAFVLDTFFNWSKLGAEFSASAVNRSKFSANWFSCFDSLFNTTSSFVLAECVFLDALVPTDLMFFNTSWIMMIDKLLAFALLVNEFLFILVLNS